MRLKDPKNKMVTFQARKREGHFTNYEILVEGDYELCFNNKYSMYENKKMMWEVDIEGDENENVNEILNNAINSTMEEFNEESKEVQSAITKVRYAIARSRHQQYWIKSKNLKDSERMETLKGMVDTWSMLCSSFVCIVMIVQVFTLRSFFNVKPPTSQLKMRT